MEIFILGSGCPRCRELEQRVINALAELNVAANVEKVTDIRKIAAYGILATPGLVIDGQLKSTGRVPSADEIKAWIREAE